MQIKRIGPQPSAKVLADLFTGTVRIDALFAAPSPATAMTHIAIQESLDGKVVEWLEHVSDEQYLSKTARTLQLVNHTC